MSAVNNAEIKSWLEVILNNEELVDLTFKIEGSTENGDGYIGDIIFVDVNGVTKEEVNKNYKLVLKCSKRSKKFRSRFPVYCAFTNEIYFYKQIYPCFIQFQEEKNVDDFFDKVPKCYGSLTTDGTEVIALENLRSRGYFLWDRRKSLTRRHIDLVMAEYGKFHAISIAMQDQQPERFDQLAKNLNDFFREMFKITDLLTIYENLIDEIHDLLQGDLPESILSKWKNLKKAARPLFEKVTHHLDGTSVIIHGDCWSNNFMHYHTNNEPTTFAMLDWQLAKLSTPILDLSYFLFACVSEQNIDRLDIILQDYHKSLTRNLCKLGSDPKLYSFDQLLQDWKKYAKYGVLVSNLLIKMSFSEKDEVPDLVKAADEDRDIATSLDFEVKDKIGLRKRFRYIVKHVVEHDLI